MFLSSAEAHTVFSPPQLNVHCVVHRIYLFSCFITSSSVDLSQVFSHPTDIHHSYRQLTAICSSNLSKHFLIAL
jgi:hypothetical protein